MLVSGDTHGNQSTVQISKYNIIQISKFKYQNIKYQNIIPGTSVPLLFGQSQIHRNIFPPRRIQTLFDR